MILGTLSLFQKRGLFCTEQEVHATERYSEMEMKALKDFEEKFNAFENLPNQHQLRPLEESGNTDYITATFEDQGEAQYPYEVTVWLLVEETPEEV